MFLYPIRADKTRRQHTSKLKAFLTTLVLIELLRNRQRNSIESVKDSCWALNIVIRLVNFQKGRATNKEITGSTLRNYYKPIKLFCKMNDFLMRGKKIAKGIPRARGASTDQAPTIEEIRTILN
jgi:hypothetical protein